MSKAKSLKDAARQLGVSDTTIKAWLRKGAPGKSGGHYDCGALAKWREENVRHKSDVSPPSEATTAKAREAAARARHWELRVQQAEGKLVDAAEVRAAIFENYSFARALLVDLPGRLLSRVELKSDKASAMLLLRGVCDDALTALSEAVRAVDRTSEESAARHASATAGRQPKTRRQ